MKRNSPCADGCQHLEEEMKSHKTGDRSTFMETVMEVTVVLGIFAHCPAAAKSLQSCPTLCDPIDGSPPGSAAPGILQARTLEWVAIAFSNA